MDKAFRPEKRLTPAEKAASRLDLMREVDEFVNECIMYCDDRQDMIALGCVLQIISKNILTGATDKKIWSNSVKDYIQEIMDEPDYGDLMRRRQSDTVPVENYKGLFY